MGGYLLEHYLEIFCLGYFQKMLTYDFIRRLKESRFGVGFKWGGSLFHIFRSKTLTPFRLYLGSVRLYLDSKHAVFVLVCVFENRLFEDVSHKNWIK